MRCAGRDGTKLFSEYSATSYEGKANLIRFISADARLGECGLHARHLHDRIPDAGMTDVAHTAANQP